MADPRAIEAAIAALRYLAEKPRPIGGEEKFNSAHCHQLADDLGKVLAAAQPQETPEQKACPKCDDQGQSPCAPSNPNCPSTAAPQKAMKMAVTPDWLRRKIETDPDIETEAATPAKAIPDAEGLIKRLRDQAQSLGNRQAEWVEHHCVAPGDAEACDAAQTMSEAADALIAATEREQAIASAVAENSALSRKLADALTAAQERIAGLEKERDEVVDALRPFGGPGGGPDMQAYHDLDDEIVVWENSGQCVSAGEVRHAREIIAKHLGEPVSMMHFRRAPTLLEQDYAALEARLALVEPVIEAARGLVTWKPGSKAERSAVEILEAKLAALPQAAPAQPVEDR